MATYDYELKFYSDFERHLDSRDKTKTFRYDDERGIEEDDILLVLLVEEGRAPRHYGYVKVVDTKTDEIQNFDEEDFDGHTTAAGPNTLLHRMNLAYDDRLYLDTEVKLIEYEFLG